MEHEHKGGLPGCRFGLAVRVRAPFDLSFRLGKRLPIGCNDEMTGFSESPAHDQQFAVNLERRSIDSFKHK